MNKTLMACALLSLGLATDGFAAEGLAPVTGVRHLDHVFLIMMENHGYSQIIGNPNAPFINNLAISANLATNYFAIAHPSLTNYLEVVGGSNFGVLSDNDPDWHNLYCATNLSSGVANTDNPPSSNICPISGIGTDAATAALDSTNEPQGSPPINNIDGTQSIDAAQNTVGKSIGDQLVEAGLSWKSYQESLPPGGADRVTYADGFFSNLTDFSKITPTLNPPLAQSGVVKLYAAKHNPFAYFQSVQEAYDPNNTLDNTVGFDGATGLYANLASGSLPNLVFIAPNQCNDQHGRGNSDQGCNFDPTDNGTQAGLNPALIIRGDVTVRRIVTAIKNSPVWHNGSNAIVIVWDENDYSTAPNTNQVVLIVETSYSENGLRSGTRYTHFSLLKSLEAGFGLPCLNHACDSSVAVMSDLFGSAPPAAASDGAKLRTGSSRAGGS